MIVTSRSKFVIQCGSTVWQQSVENGILVVQNSLEQIVRDVIEFGCCQDVRTAQSRVHTPHDTSPTYPHCGRGEETAEYLLLPCPKKGKRNVRVILINS